MDFADGSMLDTTGGTCSMAGGSMASNWCKKNKQIETTSHAQISTGRFESGNGRHGCDEKTDGLAQPR